MTTLYITEAVMILCILSMICWTVNDC